MAADRGAAWAAWINRYVIEGWDTAGRLTRTLRRDVEWFPTWWRARSDAETPPLPVTTAIQVQGDTLWVLVRVPDPDWRSAVRPEGKLYTVDDKNAYQDTMVEAIDLRTGELLASTRFPQVMDGFAGPGLVFGPASDALGNPVLPVWEVQIVHPRRE